MSSSGYYTKGKGKARVEGRPNKKRQDNTFDLAPESLKITIDEVTEGAIDLFCDEKHSLRADIMKYVRRSCLICDILYNDEDGKKTHIGEDHVAKFMCPRCFEVVTKEKDVAKTHPLHISDKISKAIKKDLISMGSGDESD